MVYYAIIDVDYTSGPYIVTFTPGDTSVAFTVTLLDDNIFERDENFTLNILPSDSFNSGNGTAIVTIVDNDGE